MHSKANEDHGSIVSVVSEDLYFAKHIDGSYN